jgi:hypothetical protein
MVALVVEPSLVLTLVDLELQDRATMVVQELMTAQALGVEVLVPQVSLANTQVEEMVAMVDFGLMGTTMHLAEVAVTSTAQVMA